MAREITNKNNIDVIIGPTIVCPKTDKNLKVSLIYKCICSYPIYIKSSYSNFVFFFVIQPLVFINKFFLKVCKNKKKLV